MKITIDKKKIIWIAILINLIIANIAYSLNWTNYDRAKVLSKNKNKPIMLMLSTEACVYCEKMHKIAFNSTNIINEIERNYIPVESKNRTLAKQFQVSTYPTIILINPDGKIEEYLKGYQNVQQLQSALHN